MTHRSLRAQIRGNTRSLKLPFLSLTSRGARPPLRKEVALPLSMTAQWSRIETLSRYAQEDAIRLQEKHQEAQEHLASLAYTLEQLHKNLAPLLETQRKSPPLVNKAKSISQPQTEIQSHSSQSQKIQDKSKFAA